MTDIAKELMSTCISPHGEFSSHSFTGSTGDLLSCIDCGVFRDLSSELHKVYRIIWDTDEPSMSGQPHTGGVSTEFTDLETAKRMAKYFSSNSRPGGPKENVRLATRWVTEWEEL